MKTAKSMTANSRLAPAHLATAGLLSALLSTTCLTILGLQPVAAQASHKTKSNSQRPFQWPTSENSPAHAAHTAHTAHTSHSTQAKTKPEAILKEHAISKAEPTVTYLKTPTLERIVISTDRLFDADQNTIMPGGEAALNKIVEHLSHWREHPVVVECHTDSFGFETYIRKLSQERADRVRVWFVQKGLLDDVQVTAVGVGKGHPIASNQLPNGKDNLVGMAANRRIEIIVDKTKAIEVAVLDPIHQTIDDQKPAPIAEKMDWTPPDERDSGDLIREADTANGGATHEPNPIIDSLPTQESAQKPRGSQDSTSQAAPAKATTEEQKRAHEWDHKEFGVWREDR
jgi:outer membrane protein OmpA-like peptidoglycan-associated protein